MLAPVILLDVAIVVLIAGIGMLAVRRVAPDFGSLGIVALGFPVGLGLTTWTLFVMNWGGIPITAPSALGVLAILMAIVVAANASWLRGVRLRRPRIRISQWDFRSWWFALGFLICVGIVGLATVSAVGEGWSSWDAIAIWSMRGYGIAAEGSIFGARWGGHGLAYPLNLSLGISVFRLVDGDTVPGSKLLFPAFLVSIVLGIYAHWRHAGMSRPLGIAGVSFLAAVPVVFEHAYLGYANLPGASYLVLGALGLVEGLRRGSTTGQVVGSAVLALAAWTRVELLLHGLGILMAVVGAAWLLKSGRPKVLALIVPFLVIVGPWVLFYIQYGAGGSQAMVALGAASATPLTRGAILLPGYRILRGYLANAVDVTQWGYLYLGGLAMCFVGWRAFARPLGMKTYGLLGAWLAATASTLFVFYVGSFGIGLAIWFPGGLGRHSLPAAILFWTLGMMSLNSAVNSFGGRVSAPSGLTTEESGETGAKEWKE